MREYKVGEQITLDIGMSIATEVHYSCPFSEKVCKVKDFYVPYKDMGLSIIGINGRSIYKVEVLDNEVKIVFKTEEQY